MWLLCLAVFIVVLFLLIDTRRPYKFPPGPRWMPIVGNYFLFRRVRGEVGFTHLVWDRMSALYGPIVGLRMGKDRLVIGSHLTVVKQLLTRDVFDARPDGFFFRLRAFGQRYGLVFVDGDFFTEQKRFCMKHLKLFGLNTSTMEERILVETTELIQNIAGSGQDSVQVPDILELSVLNILWSFVAGRRFNLNDPLPKEMLNLIHESFRLQDMSGGILNQMPFIRFFLPELSSFNKLTFVLNGLISFIKEIVEEHKATISPKNTRDLIDAYIKEMKKCEGRETTFTDKQLIILLLDLLLAGAETTSASLGFAILYLLHFPEVQSKMHQELDSVLGNKQPLLHYRNRLIYMEAFLMELQRHANVTPTTVSHRAKEDAEIFGYRIPKDTILIANLYSIHVDKSHWGDPEQFRPERFINKNGEIVQDDWLIPFGLGKRRCIGEGLAKATIYLFLASILQKFTILPDEDHLPPLAALDGATISPKPFRCRFLPRL